MIRELKTKGFTLVEVLASVLILAGTIVFLIRYTADGLTASLEIERRVKSTLLAEGEMEKIKNVLRKSFETDFTVWPSSLEAGYLAGRTSKNVSSTLKIIGVSVGYDADKNGSLGTDEIMVTFKTQYAKRS
jgi:prepilin-type N-terminal cleavage/methylation domain-containing protein